MEHIRLDRDERGGVTVVVDGTPQSHVQLDDPLLLVFEYVEHFALVLDTLPQGPLAVTHIGGGGMTLARWVQATRPGSPQIVLEPDVAVTELVRKELPLPRGSRIRVRPVDGATGMRQLRPSSADVVVLDAYAAGRVPAELTTTAHFRELRRVLRPDGVALLNIADEAGRRFIGRVLASLRAVGFPQLVVVATVEVLRGRRFGNYVIAATAGSLDIEAIRRAVAGMPLPTGVRYGVEVDRVISGARPLTEDDASMSPEPPEPGVWNRR